MGFKGFRVIFIGGISSFRVGDPKSATARVL
jgi:hypothetical protein